MPEYDSTQFSLPLDMENSRHFELFMHAIDDPQLRADLRRSSLPPQPEQLLALADDRQFLELSRDAAERYRDALAGRRTVDDVTDAARRVSSYLEDSFPAALAALTRFAEDLQQRSPRLRALAASAGGPAFSAIHTEAVANAEAVVNAAVWANVAVATNFLVAAEVVFVLAIIGLEETQRLHPSLDMVSRVADEGIIQLERSINEGGGEADS